MPDSGLDTISLRDDHPVAKSEHAASECAITERRSERAACRDLATARYPIYGPPFTPSRTPVPPAAAR